MAESRRKLAELYEKFYPNVYYRALYLLRRWCDAEDAASEVFVRVARGLIRNPALEVSKSAILRVTTHACIDRLRSSSFRREHVVDPVEGFDRFAVDQDATARLYLKEILGRLRGGLREIAIYYYMDGFTLAELSRITGLSEKTLGRRLKKIAKKLSAILELDRRE